jgi:beta-lactam-binding protein with PASTA domain
MSENKDFLKSLVNEKKPASFEAEQIEPVRRNWKAIITVTVISIIAVILLVVGYWFMFGSVVMPDLVGKTQEDIAVWTKENGINNSKIVVTKDFDFDIEKDLIIEQSISKGKRISRDTVISFIISEGADPDEKIAFPDLMTMDLLAIQNWITTNKLTNTKVTLSYNSKIQKDAVIAYELKNEIELNFTRGSRLDITVSRGKQPIGEVVVPNFVGQFLTEVNTWGTTNGVIITKTEQYSDSVEIGKVLSQSVVADGTIKKGETLKVTVSKGKAIYMGDLVKMSKDQALAWCGSKSIICSVEEYYSTLTKGVVYQQSKAKGSVIDSGTLVTLSVSKGQPDISTFFGTSLSDLTKWVAEQNVMKANLSGPTVTYQFGERGTAGKIIEITSTNLSIGSEVKVVVSKGLNIYIDPTYFSAATDESGARAMCTSLGLNCIFDYRQGSGPISSVYSMKLDDGTDLKGNSYVLETRKVYIWIISSNP